MLYRDQPTRSAITVAGISGNSASSARIRGSHSSTADPFGARSYFGRPTDPKVRLTVFLEIPNRRDALDRHALRPTKTTNLAPVLHGDHSPIDEEGSSFNPARR